MRQSQIFCILILGLGLALSTLACSTMYVDSFDKVKVNMSKDDVLDLVGSPNRTERIDGKDKWAYRFYTDSDKSQWDYRQVTFLNGKVISAGVDTDELNRLKAIEADDKAREERRNAAKQNAASDSTAGAAGSSANLNLAPQPAVDASAPAHIPTESDFVEVKGKHAPVDNSEGEK